MPENIIEQNITIVIPCKNEEQYISHLLHHLKRQNIGNTEIVIADCSTDNTRQVIKMNMGELNIKIIDGGPVSFAKNSGAVYAKTPYILFIDSDVRFFSDDVILDCITEMKNKNLDLIGLNIKCYDNSIRAKIGFMIFNVVNNIMKYKVPFAVGAFMLTRADKFTEFGGFSEKYQTSEDFFLSKKYDVRKFKLMKHYLGQDSRRFERMGYTGMAWYLIKNFSNRNKDEYWNKKDHSKYWNN